MWEHGPAGEAWDAEKACLHDSSGSDGESGGEYERGCSRSRTLVLLGSVTGVLIVVLCGAAWLQNPSFGAGNGAEAELSDALSKPPMALAALPAFTFSAPLANFSSLEKNMSSFRAPKQAMSALPSVPFAPVKVDGVRLDLDTLRSMNKADLGVLTDKLEPVVMAAKELQARAATPAHEAPTPPPLPPALALPAAPLFTFYLYRAQNDRQYYPFGNVNAANLEGVMWYLANEVMPRCPKRYHITRIKRLLVTTRATPELYLHGMNFGVRYSYDAGKCTGSNTLNLGPCSDTWNRFGYVPGCNKFMDKFPWPIVDTQYPNGIWYDLPLEGKCDKPTGAWNCTWSAEEAGEIRLEELESSVPGYGYCCNGNCTGFWQGVFSRSRCDQRVQQAADMFRQKYPEMPDRPLAHCDFNRQQFWA